MSIQPIFLFSISRSGSTLVQRIIAAHDGVATVSEPWLLLPHAYTLRRTGVDAEYPHATMVDAIEDFCAELPSGEEDYRRELHDYVLRLYRHAAGPEARWFLDKSPYYLVAEEVMSLFPEGKFVFLWRNPLSIAASSMDAWDDEWKPTLFRHELFVGLPRLVSTYQKNIEHVYSMRYEDLIGGEERHWRPLMSYLGLDFDLDTLTEFAAVKLNGRMGDPTGVTQYTTLSTAPMYKWKQALANPLRKEWCRRYLRFFGNERLSTMGYDGQEILQELEAAPTNMEHFLPDLGRLLVDVAKEPIRVRTRNSRLGGPNVIRELLNA